MGFEHDLGAKEVREDDHLNWSHFLNERTREVVKKWVIEIHPRPPGKNHKSCDLSDLDRTQGRDLRRGKLIKLPRLSNGVLHVYHRICP